MPMMQKDKIIFPELSFKINGVLFAVRKEQGRFKNEKQYCDAIEEKFRQLNIIFEREKILEPSFPGEKSGRNRIDFLVENKIILEIKAKPFLTKTDYYQTRRYLSSLNKKLAILVNMRRNYIHPKRILNSEIKEW